MPLLTMAMSDVPPRDAGLGSGIINVSQQVSGAFGLAVLGTLASTRSKGLEAQGHALASSLLSGYHLAFEIGAACLVVGIVLAMAILRPLDARAATAASAPPTAEPELAIIGATEPEFELEAA